MTISDIAKACLDLAASIERKGPASNHFLRRVAGCLRYVPRGHLSRHHADLLTGTVLSGKAQPDDLRSFAETLMALEAA